MRNITNSKYFKSVIHRLYFFVIVFLISLVTFSCKESKSTFVVSDVTIKENISTNKRDRYIQSALGSEIDLEFYDTKVKVIIKEGNDEEKRVFILDRVNDKQYKYSTAEQVWIHNFWGPNRGDYVMEYRDLILDLNNKFGLYNSDITLSWYKDGNLLRSAKAKRKGI